MTEYEVVLEGINKSFAAPDGNDVHVLRDVELSVRRGEFVVLLGPSGCGKSTTLRIVAGLEHPESGSVAIGGKEVAGIPAAQRRIGMVFQNYALYPHLNVRENIIFGLKARREDREIIEDRLERTARTLELSNFLDRKPAQLSGGQRQRVALGRALVGEARVVLMDEPLSNLDAKLRNQMRLELRGLQRQLGLTVIYVTHDQVEAMTMADRVAVMNAGRIEQFDEPLRLYREPATAFVAGFIGFPPMNLLRAEDLRAIASHQDDSSAAMALLPPGTSVLPESHLVGIRPEDVDLDHPRGGDGLRGTLSTVEFLGAEAVVTVDIGASLTVRVPGERNWREGESVTVLPTREKIKTFPDPAATPEGARGREAQRGETKQVTR